MLFMQATFSKSLGFRAVVIKVVIKGGLFAFFLGLESFL